MEQIVVVGSANIDFVVEVERLPEPGETVHGKDLAMTFGGKGANEAVAVRRLGGDVLFLCKLGDDVLGSRYREHLQQEGLRTEAAPAPPDTPTGAALILVDRSGQNVIAVSPGANAHLGIPDVERIADRISAARLVVLQCEIPLETNLHVLRLACASGGHVIFNPSPVPTGFPWGQIRIAYLVLNEGELAAVTGSGCRDTQDMVAAARMILTRQVDSVIVTRGADATLVVTPEESFSVPTVPITPVDTVGAGDAFAGALAVGLTEGKSLADAVSMANCVGALTATRRGAQVSIPRRDELGRFMDKTVASNVQSCLPRHGGVPESQEAREKQDD